MRKQSLIIYILFILIIAIIGNGVFAQKNKNKTTHSSAQSDSATIARQHYMDSVKTERKRTTDSLTAIRKQRTDSMKAVTAHRNSKAYKDSVKNVRTQQIAQNKATVQHRLDSMKLERKRLSDSTAAVRKVYNDSVKTAIEAQKAIRKKSLDSTLAARKKITDSLAAIRKYRESKQYKDSLKTIKAKRADSLKQARIVRLDSVYAARDRRRDSLQKVIQHNKDSIKTVIAHNKEMMKVRLDSIKVVRAQRMDSLAKLKAERLEKRKKLQEERDAKRKKKYEDKVKKKQDAYSNDKMRKKKWSFTRKIIQNTFTRYNYFYNADRKIKLAETNMRRAHIDNYNQPIPLFPFNPDKDSTRFKSDMDSIISTISVGTQIHDPRSKWQDNLFLVGGKAFYYKGDYKNAAASFKYIVAENELEKREKEKQERAKGNKSYKADKHVTESEKTGLAKLLGHESSKNEALLWLSRVFTQQKDFVKAEMILDMVSSDKTAPPSLAGQVAIERAFILEQSGNELKMMPYLSVATNNSDLPDWLRMRAAFLNGQLLMNNGQLDSANHYFAKALGFHPEIQMDFNAHIFMVNNSIKNDTGIGNLDKVASVLKDMIGDNRYLQYKDQLFYSLAQTDIKSGKDSVAIEHFKASIRSSTNNNAQKGLSFASLGDLYYQKDNYRAAKNSYDSANIFLANNTDFAETIERTAQKAASLDQLFIPYDEVSTQDSLLRLSALSESEQRKYIDKYISRLAKQRRDSIDAMQNKQNAPTNQPMSINMGQSNATSWYYANSSAVQKGKDDFKQKWGNRSLKDDWNRSLASSSNNGNSPGSEEENDPDAILNLPDADTLYAQIPHGTEAINRTKNRISEGMYQLALAYLNPVKDYQKSLETWDSLDHRFPGHPHEADEIYARYQIALVQGKKELAQQLKNQLQSNYKDSKGAKDIARQEAIIAESNNNNKETIAQFYDKIYEKLSNKNYQEVKSLCDEIATLYPSEINSYANRVFILRVSSEIGLKEFKPAKDKLVEFINLHPNDTLTPYAKALLKNVTDNQNEASIPQNANLTGLNMPNTSAFVYNKSELPDLVIAVPQDQMLNSFKEALNQYLTQSLPGKNVTVTMQPLNTTHILLICKPFDNVLQAKGFINNLPNQTFFKTFYPTASTVSLFLLTPTNLPILLKEGDLKNYLQFYQSHY